MMYRKGMDITLRLIMVGVVLLIIAYVVGSGAYSNIGGFNFMAGENIHSSDINICANNVEGFCDIEENSEKSWAERYPECEEFSDAISEGTPTVNADGTCDPVSDS